jgi:hypothetical protein
MQQRALRSFGVAGSLALAAALAGGSAQAADVYSQTITNPLAVVSTLDDFSNCRDSEGCLGKLGQVFDAAGNPLAATNLPDTLLFTFTLSPAERAAVLATPGGTGTLTMTAARDLGLRAGTAVNTDFLVTSVEGTGIGNLYGTTVSTCPAGENFGPINFSCGPNYHNDVTAMSSLSIPAAVFLAAANDGSFEVLVNPTDDVGRLKVFSLTLSFTNPVPEPASAWLAAAGLLGLAGLVRRRRRAG